MDDQLKQELLAIAEILAKYPEGLQERVFEIAIGDKAHTPRRQPQGEDPSRVSSDKPDATSKPSHPTGNGGGTRKRTGTASETYALVNDLDLRAGTGVLSFREFVDSKKPKTDPEFITVAVYYLMHLKKRDSVTLPEIYTCFKDVKRKVPGKLSQGVRNTKTRCGSVDFSKSVAEITLTVLGENMVEQDLPAAASE